LVRCRIDRNIWLQNQTVRATHCNSNASSMQVQSEILIRHALALNFARKAAMRLVGIAVVRDEEDILEAFVRHNVQFLDHLYIVAHRCRDNSEHVLQSLRYEGLPLSIVRRQDKGLRKSAWLNELAAQSFSEGADAVAALDADEFIKVEDGKRLIRRLDSFPESLHPAWRWQSYVPTVALLSQGAASGVNVLRDIRHRLKDERWTVLKVILRRNAARLGWRFDEGAHRLVGRPDVCRIGVMPDCWLAHFPVRSLEQFERKIIRGWHARLIHCPMPDISSHWRHVYESMVSTGAATPQLLRRIAADYQRTSGDWDSLHDRDLVEDPMDVSLGEAGALPCGTSTAGERVSARL
jgi:hypothetical protein